MGPPRESWKGIRVGSCHLEADISEAGEHLSTVEVRLSNEPDYSARVTGESEEPDVSGES